MARVFDKPIVIKEEDILHKSVINGTTVIIMDNPYIHGKTREECIEAFNRNSKRFKLILRESENKGA